MPLTNKSRPKPNRGHLPWIAMLDAIIADLEMIGVSGSEEDILIDAPKSRGAIRVNSELQSNDDDLHKAYKTLSRAKAELKQAIYTLYSAKLISIHEQSELSSSVSRNDDRINSRMRLEGKEGWARLIQHGGFIGPATGAQLSAIIRGEKKFRKGQSSSSEEERKRLFAVKRVATIEHLFSVGTKKAIGMYCDFYHPDDPSASKVETVISWVKRQRKRANETRNNPVSTKRELRNAETILNGLCIDQARGVLRGQPVDKLEAYLRSIRT